MNMDVVSANHQNYLGNVKRDVKQTENKGASRAETPDSLKGTQGKANETKLSSKAQDLLKKLRKKYGDCDFMVGTKKDDLKALANSGNKEFSVVITDTELERMASDEKYAQERMSGLEGAMRMSEEINEKFGFGQENADGVSLTKAGVLLGDNGMTKFFAELEKSGAMQKERIEKAREAQNYSKNNAGVKCAHVQADSMEELLEKIAAVDWNSVKSEKMPESGSKFDFSI